MLFDISVYTTLNELLAVYIYVYIYRAVQKKMAKSLWHHNFATVHHRVMRFSAKCSERNSLHDKSQYLNTTIKYFLFCRWQVSY